MDDKSFLEELRSRTGPMHRKLEQTATSQRMVSPGLDLNAYRDYLKKVHSLHRGVEGSVFPVVTGILDDLELRRKLPAIESDLAHVGVTLASSGVEFVDRHFKPDAAFCMGIMYVSEGSTLGGMVIVKNVEAALGSAAEGATGFLTVYEKETGGRWKKFLQSFGTFQATCDESAKNRIIDGAIYGFNRTHEIFSN